VAVGFAFPTGTSNSFFATGPVTGNGQGGTVTFFHCYRFSSASFVDVAFLITDTVGLPSNVLAIQIAKPSGGNAPLPGP
jgi:hypothetical protein